MLSHEINKLKADLKKIEELKPSFQSIANQISDTIEKLEQANEIVISLKKLRGKLK